VTCSGPLVWFDVAETDTAPPAAVLECAACDYVIATGSFFDPDHSGTDIIRSGQ
jgi:hypothetical protein